MGLGRAAAEAGYRLHQPPPTSPPAVTEQRSRGAGPSACASSPALRCSSSVSWATCRCRAGCLRPVSGRLPALPQDLHRPDHQPRRGFLGARSGTSAPSLPQCSIGSRTAPSCSTSAATPSACDHHARTDTLRAPPPTPRLNPAKGGENREHHRGDSSSFVKHEEQ